MRYFYAILAFVILGGCVEPYEAVDSPESQLDLTSLFDEEYAQLDRALSIARDNSVTDPRDLVTDLQVRQYDLTLEVALSLDLRRPVEGNPEDCACASLCDICKYAVECGHPTMAKEYCPTCTLCQKGCSEGITEVNL